MASKGANAYCIVLDHNHTTGSSGFVCVRNCALACCMLRTHNSPLNGKGVCSACVVLVGGTVMSCDEQTAAAAAAAGGAETNLW